MDATQQAKHFQAMRLTPQPATWSYHAADCQPTAPVCL